jgi:hypothetical protein
MQKLGGAMASHHDHISSHPSIDNPYGFPLPVPGAVILEEEVVKEGHLVKNLKRRLFTLVIDAENFPCLTYTYALPLSHRAVVSHVHIHTSSALHIGIAAARP